MSEFEIGEEVVVVEALGRLRNDGSDDGAYFYGGNVGAVPLETKGKIVHKLSSGGYQLLLNSGNCWSVHSDEIEMLDSYQALLRKFPEIKNIGKHPLIELAEQNPLVIFDEKVYSLCEGNCADNYVEFEGRLKAPLEEIGEVSMFDELFYQRENTLIDLLEKKYAEDYGKKVLFKEGLAKNLPVQYYIFNNVFPHLRSNEYAKKIENMLSSQEIFSDIQKEGEGVEKQILGKNDSFIDECLNKNRLVNEVLKSVDELILKIEKENFKTGKKSLSKEKEAEKERGNLIDKMLSYFKSEKKQIPSMFKKAVGEKNIALLNGLIYDDVPVSDADKFATILSVEGKKWHLTPSNDDVSGIQKYYLFLLAKKIRIDALKNYFTKEKIEEFINNNLNFKFSVLDTYEEQDFGFIKREGQYYVYLKVPEFAIKNKANNKCYHYKQTKVALRVKSDSGGFKLDYYPYMIEANHHPITYGTGGGFAAMCWGRNIPPLGKEVGETIALMLKKLKDIVMFGYRNTDVSAFNNSENLIKSIEELKRKGIMIVNEDV